MIDRFGRWAMQAGSTVETVPDPAGARAAIARLAERLRASRVTATREAAGFAPPGALVGGSAVQVADADLGISVAILAVAETGSVLLGFEAADDRLVGMLAQTHAVLVPAGVLCASLDDAAVALRAMAVRGPGQRLYLTLTTGPSRTADIERVLTIGVQGPRAVHLVVVAGGLG